MRITFKNEIYNSIDWFEAWITKGGMSRLVMVGLPYYTWKESFESYARQRGFSVTWR